MDSWVGDGGCSKREIVATILAGQIVKARSADSGMGGLPVCRVRHIIGWFGEDR